MNFAKRLNCGLVVGLLLFAGEGAALQADARTALNVAGMSYAVEIEPNGFRFGLWVNIDAWSGCGSEPCFNVGVKLTTTPVDDLSAIKNAPVLATGQSAEWTLKMLLV